MQALRELISQSLGLEAWLAMLAAIVVVALVLSTGTRLLLNQLDRVAQRSHNVWDASLMRAVHLPVHGLIWLLASIGMARAARPVARF